MKGLQPEGMAIMKHLKPVSKAATASVSSIVTLVVALMSALAPIVQYAVESKQNTEV
jgi:hypothetical protein